MRAFLVFLLFCIFLLAGRWYYVCKIEGLCNDQTDDQRLSTLSLTEGDSVLLSGYDHFAFDSAGFRPRLNENNRRFLDTLAALLRKDTLKHLTITGYARQSEQDIRVGFFESIGVARAAEVRKELMKREVEEKRITLDREIDTERARRRPIAFELYMPVDSIPAEFEKTSFTFTNMTFSDANFAFDSDEFRPGEAFVRYADSVKTYLVVNPDKQITIIGHTDNIGTDQYNLDLGLRRAESAREYFRELGVPVTIRLESKGEDRPVAPNDEPENRQKNRRVNFVITDEGGASASGGDNQ